MVSRSGMVRTSMAQNTRTKNRRRINVSMPTTGAEMSLPPVALPRLGWRVLSFLIVAGLIFALYSVWTAPQFQVTTDVIAIEGLSRIEQGEFLDLADILDKPVFLVDSVQLQQDLLTLVPALDELTITVGFPNGVQVTAVERTPVIAWQQTDINQVWWIDNKGMRFPAIGSSDGLVTVVAKAAPPALAQASPAATENSAETATAVPKPEDSMQLLEDDLVKAVLYLAGFMPDGAQMVFDGEYGLGWQDPQYQWTVYFGSNPDRMNLRVNNYQAIYDYFSSRNRKPVMISVAQIHAPYYRMKP